MRLPRRGRIRIFWWYKLKDKIFLRETSYIDYSSPLIAEKTAALFDGLSDPVAKVQAAYKYVRDEIPHTFDIGADVVSASASDVLRLNTGTCHSKSNLLAALLRSQKIPAGFRYQRLTLADDDSKGYCLHCLNAVFINELWIMLDARGNTNGKNAQFSLGEPILAFANRPQYDEYFYDGIYADPDEPTMKLLTTAKTLGEVLSGLPDKPFQEPDILEF